MSRILYNKYERLPELELELEWGLLCRNLDSLSQQSKRMNNCLIHYKKDCLRGGSREPQSIDLLYKPHPNR